MARDASKVTGAVAQEGFILVNGGTAAIFFLLMLPGLPLTLDAISRRWKQTVDQTLGFVGMIVKMNSIA